MNYACSTATDGGVERHTKRHAFMPNFGVQNTTYAADGHFQIENFNETLLKVPRDFYGFSRMLLNQN